MLIHSLEQGTPEWFAIRKGKMTASHAQAIGNDGKGLDTYIFKIMAEEYSSGEVVHFSNDHTDRGNELEGVARSLYEMENDVIVEQVGFIEHDNYVGCSPDGIMTGQKGGLEIKCKDDIKHFKLLINGDKEIESGHVWQVQMNLLITGFEWWDYVAYNPNFEKSIFIKRFYPDPEKFDALLKGFKSGIEKIEKIKKQLSNAN